MGSSGAKETTKPVWAAGSQEERLFVAAQLAKKMSGQKSWADRLQEQMARDQTVSRGYMDREMLMRSYGRAPGVAGPERFQELRNLQDSYVRSLATVDTQASLGNRSAALDMMLKHSMQAPAQKGQSGEGAAGPAGGVGQLAGLLASTLSKKGGGATGQANYVDGGAAQGTGSGAGMTAV